MLDQHRLDRLLDGEVAARRDLFEKLEDPLQAVPAGAGGQDQRRLSGMLAGEEADLFDVHQTHHGEAGGQLLRALKLVAELH